MPRLSTPLDLAALLGAPLPQRRLVLFAGGGLLLAGLLAAQSALEQTALPASPTPIAATPGTAAPPTDALPDYSAFAAAPAAESAWWIVLSGLALKLLVVLLLIYATIWLLRRYLGRTAGATPTASALRVLQTLPLGQHQMVHLVELGDRLLVVGATPHQISLLTEVDDAAAIGELRLRADQGNAAAARPFGDQLRALITSPASSANAGQRPVPDAAAAAPTTPAARRSAARPDPRPARPRQPAAPSGTSAVSSDPPSAPDASDSATPGSPRAIRRPGPPSEASTRAIEAALRDGRDALARQIAALQRGPQRPAQ